MKQSRTLQALIISGLVLYCMLLSCVNLSGGTETGDARVSGMLYNPNGSGAMYATVKVTRWNRSARDSDLVFDTTITDSSGAYRFASVPSDTYTILGAGDSGFSYLDSVVVNANDTHMQLPPDTLKPSGSVSGRVTLENGGDPRTVRILVMGTTSWAAPYDSSGNFTVSPVAEGSYRIRIIDTLGNYQPKDTVLQVTAGKESPLSHPLSLVSAPPPPTTYRFLNTFGDSASIGDTVWVIASSADTTRKITAVQWFIDNKDSLKRASTAPSPSGKDTLRAAWNDPSRHRIYTAVTDEAHAVRWDSTTIIVVRDPPIAGAGNDTILPVNGTIPLHGGATQKFGTIVKWEWKFDSGPWNTTGGPDTVFMVPSTKDSYVCSLAVTDDDGNRACDEIRIVDGKKVIGVAAGGSHSFFLKAGGTLWACGWVNGMGLSHEIIDTPVQVMAHVRSMDAGVLNLGSYAHNLILKTDGTLWMYGYQRYAMGYMGGTPGYDTGTSLQPSPVQLMADVRSMAVSEQSHDLILKTDNTLWSCGNNNAGQLGDGTMVFRKSPVQVMTEVKSMDAGSDYSLILKADNTLWVCGYNGDGRLGDGTTFNRSPPIQIMTDVKSIAVGSSHNLILKTDNTLWACGNNEDGQLGDGTTTSRSVPAEVMTDVKAVAAGPSYSLILKTDGTLWACGRNNSGQLGDGTTDNRPTPVRVMTNVETMAAGGSHSLILKTDNTLWACGYNYWGQLGDGTTVSSPVPKAIILPTK
jgi:alpha-tubulin suppressor-like RCC1 family protein